MRWLTWHIIFVQKNKVSDMAKKAKNEHNHVTASIDAPKPANKRAAELLDEIQAITTELKRREATK